MKLKQLAVALLTASLLVPAVPARASIPVVDAVGNAQELAHWTEKLKQWTETVQHYRSQLDAYKDQLATATGLRDIQGLVSEGKSLKDDIARLRKQGISLNDLLTSDNPPTGALNRLYEKYKDFDVCSDRLQGINEAASRLINVCKQETANKGSMIEQTVDVQKQVDTALRDIGRLSDRIANAKDSKESQDLANAIHAKSVQLNTITSAWEMNIKAAEQRDKLLEAKRRKAFREQQANAPLPQF
ncbi:type IV secretion system protein [Salmonella enterica]|nr:type IV secretion system protein [Salmonella enterica]